MFSSELTYQSLDGALPLRAAKEHGNAKTPFMPCWRSSFNEVNDWIYRPPNVIVTMHQNDFNNLNNQAPNSSAYCNHSSRYFNPYPQQV